MIKQFYQDIKTHLETQLNGNVFLVDLWNNQLNNEDQEKPFRFPALFIEFTDVEYRSEAYGIQKADINFTVHCAFSQLVKDMDLLDVVESVAVALHNHSGEYFSDITRVRVIQDDDHDRVSDWQIEFTCTMTDCSTAKVNKLVQTTPTIIETTRTIDIDNDVIKTGDGQD